MSKQEVILCRELESSLAQAVDRCPHDKLFILTDEHTHRLCLPRIQNLPALEGAEEIVIGAEDVNKNLETLASVWQALSSRGIAVRAGLHCAPLAHENAGTLEAGTVRASVSDFNTPAEIDRFIWEISRLCLHTGSKDRFSIPKQT